MASITVINMTNTLVNSTATYDGINSSVRNGLNPGEFYVHSAGGVYTLNVRYFTGRESMYRENWERLGDILGQVVLNLVAAGLSIFGVGQIIAAGSAAAAASPALWAAANLTQKAAMTVLQMSVSGLLTSSTGVALDIASLTMGIKDIVLKDMPADKEWTQISGYDDRVFALKGGQKVDVVNGPDGKPASATVTYEPLRIEEITDRAIFENMKKKNEIYEETRLGHVILFDAQGKRYYTDSTGNKVYDLEAKENRPQNPYTNTTTSNALTKNKDGQWTPEVYTLPSGTSATSIDGFEVRDQPGYGVINLRAFYSVNKMTAWVRDEMGNSSAFSHEYHVSGDPISRIEVREEGGYGIIDMRVHTLNQKKDPPWIIGNTFKESEKRDHVFEVPSDKIIVGVIGKQQGTYGLVDVKFVLAPRPGN
ncbi:MAG: hypothetical protein HOW73_13400 [Polyangiaceae bacterium]|nr:hypothetical protein [Polyangiaceae bacterium]